MTEEAPVIDWRHHILRRKTNVRRRSGNASSDARIDQGFADLKRLRNSTAKEELPERLKRVVEKLRRQED
ncbi:MAG: hypothetical protein WEA84_14510 [Rhodovibrionaceae bacterium]